MKEYYNILKTDPLWDSIRKFHIRYEDFVAKNRRGTWKEWRKEDHNRYKFLTQRLVVPWKIVQRNTLYTIYDHKGRIWFRVLDPSELFEALKICVKAAKRSGIVKPISKSPVIGKPPWTENEIIKAGKKIYKRQFTWRAKFGIHFDPSYHIYEPRMMMYYVGLGVHITRNWNSFWGSGPISGIHRRIYRELCNQLRKKKTPLPLIFRKKKTPLLIVRRVWERVFSRKNKSILAQSVRLTESNLSKTQRSKIFSRIADSSKGIYIYDFENNKLYE
jgi:hypothetical protein